MYFLFFFLISKIKSLSAIDNNCQLFSFGIQEGYASLPGYAPVEINFQKFTRFNQFNLSCFSKTNPAYEATKLIIRPGKKLILDSSFKIEQTKNLKLKFSKQLTIYFVDIKGFNIQSVLFDSNRKYSLEFYYSNFDFYLKNSLYLNCNNSDFLSFFKNIYYLKFAFSVKYTPNICPYLFKNSSLDIIEFYGLSNTFIKKNILGFIPTSELLNFKLNEFYIYFYKPKLDEKLFDQNLFKFTQNIHLNGVLDQLNPNLFDKLVNLKNLELFIQNFAYFLSKNRKFFRDFSKYQNLTLTLTHLNYFYPDKDFCLFIDIPKNVCINLMINFNCTCTLLWINKNTLNNSKCLTQLRYVCKYFDSSKCNFNLKTCLKSDINQNSYGLMDVLYISQIVDYTSVILIPIFSLIGISANLICILALIDSKTELKQFLIFKLIFVNFFLNFIYCFIYLFHLINKCVSVNGIFCSPINKYFASQVYDIYVIRYFGSVIKIFSTILIICISLCRIDDLTNNFYTRTYKFLKLTKKKLINLIIFLVLITLASNIYIIFTNKINENLFSLDEYTYTEFPIKNIFLNAFLFKHHDEFVPVENSQANKSIFLTLFNVNFILNDLGLFLIMTGLDLVLIIKLRSILRDKSNLMQNFNLNQLKLKIKRIECIKMRTTSLLVLNSFILFCIRSLHFSASLLVFIQHEVGVSTQCFKNMNKICSNILDASEVLFLFSCSYSIVIYYNMDKNIKSIIFCFILKIFAPLNKKIV